MEKVLTSKQLKKWNETHIIIDGIDHKKCNVCTEFFPATEDNFYKNSSNSIDGLNAYCIECTKLRSVKWAKSNPERRKELKNNYNRSKTYIIERRRESTRLRKELGKEKEWQKNNKEKLGEYTKTKQTYRTHTITLGEWNACKSYFNNSCAYCELHIDDHYRIYAGKPQKVDLHKEHVEDKGANDLSNCIPSCGECNSSKWEFSLDEWYNEINPKYTIERYSKIVKWLQEDYKQFCSIK